jgi:hypothetical protein
MCIVSLDLSYTNLRAMPTLIFELKHLQEFRLGKAGFVNIKLGMHRIPVLFSPDIRLAGYPANPKAGYRISGKGQISGRILGLTTIFLVKYQINL